MKTRYWRRPTIIDLQRGEKNGEALVQAAAPFVVTSTPERLPPASTEGWDKRHCGRPVLSHSVPSTPVSKRHQSCITRSHIRHLQTTQSRTLSHTSFPNVATSCVRTGSYAPAPILAVSTALDARR